MCGIVGAVSKQPVADILLNGLKKLEYRGYDSAGIAVIEANHQINRLRVAGKVRELEAAMQHHSFAGHTGIAHTRWATHGVPAEKNAHPLISHDKFALVHNGIIENHAHLREKLLKENYIFSSDTDTEVIVHLIHHYFKEKNDLLAAVYATIDQLKGAYALGIISHYTPSRLIAVRHGSPLIIGEGQGENFIASDPLALLASTQQFIYLDDYDVADITPDSIHIYDKHKKLIKRASHTIAIRADVIERGEFRHYMKKEIMEQPDVIVSCLEGRIANDHVLPAIFGPTTEAIFPRIRHVHFVSCGTSYHAALVGRYWIEALAGIPCTVEIASEFRYRPIAQSQDSLFVTLSQSGETADTLAALRLAKKMHYLSTLAICNVPDSSMLREADLHFLTRAGIEIGVASTKAFITQLISLILFALSLRATKTSHDSLEKKVITELTQLPTKVRKVLDLDSAIMEWATLFTDKQHALFVGRGLLYPIALEGALKMKEISYIHAEGYPAGELKHGPLALVDKHMPVIATVPENELLEKVLSNLQEVAARSGQLFIFTDQADLEKQHAFAHIHRLEMPSIDPLLAPILYTIPLQLLAYHVAVSKGTDIDQPRNLAKSVTVE